MTLLPGHVDAALTMALEAERLAERMQRERAMRAAGVNATLVAANLVAYDVVHPSWLTPLSPVVVVKAPKRMTAQRVQMQVVSAAIGAAVTAAMTL